MKMERDTGYQSKASKILRKIVRFNPRFPNFPPSSSKKKKKKKFKQEKG